MSGYIKALKDKDTLKLKNKNSKVMAIFPYRW